MKTTCFVLFTILAITHFNVRQSYGVTEPTPVHKWQYPTSKWMLSDTLLKHFTTKCCFDMKTTRPSHSAHLIKPQTLRGLINVPAKFHKWGINYNWFHSLIHLLKWHTFFHVLTCFAISPCLRGMSWLPHTLFKVSLSDFCYTKIISTAPRWIQHMQRST